MIMYDVRAHHEHCELQLVGCVQQEVAVKIMKIKPGAKQESLTELPYTEAAIAGICIHANIVQTLYSDLLPVFDKEDQNTFWSKAKDERTSRKDSFTRAAAQAGESGVKEWQVRMVMEICDLGMSGAMHWIAVCHMCAAPLFVSSVVDVHPVDVTRTLAVDTLPSR
jgi:hypothetical protein